MLRLTIVLLGVILFANVEAAHGQTTAQPPKSAPAGLVGGPSFEAADVAVLGEGQERLELFLLLGQSNMKGRGALPAEPLSDERIVMMHRRSGDWYLARHPLHLVGDAKTFERADNAGVGAGIMFAQTLLKTQKNVRIGLVPCAVGGTGIGKWAEGARLYDESIKRAKQALADGPAGKTRIAGALWLQGESDSKPEERTAKYPAALRSLVDRLRKDLGIKNLPFIACTIGEFREGEEGRVVINGMLLDLKNQRKHTACVDVREMSGHIGDRVHYDRKTQEEIGRQFAKKYLEIKAE